MSDILTAIGVMGALILLIWTASTWHVRGARWRWWKVAVAIGLTAGAAAGLKLGERLLHT